jgi:hypothetical protein
MQIPHAPWRDGSSWNFPRAADSLESALGSLFDLQLQQETGEVPCQPHSEQGRAKMQKYAGVHQGPHPKKPERPHCSWRTSAGVASSVLTVAREGPEPVTSGTQATAGGSGALTISWELMGSLVGKRAAIWASYRVQGSCPRSSVTCEGHKLILASCMVSYTVPLSVSTVQSQISCSWLSF